MPVQVSSAVFIAAIFIFHSSFLYYNNKVVVL